MPQHTILRGLFVLALLPAVAQGAGDPSPKPAEAAPPAASAPAGTPSSVVAPTPSAAKVTEVVGPTWVWESTERSGRQRSVPEPGERWTFVFDESGDVVVKTGCYDAKASYEFTGDELTLLTPLRITRHDCPQNPNDNRFALDLIGLEVGELKDGRVQFNLKSGRGTITLRPEP